MNRLQYERRAQPLNRHSLQLWQHSARAQRLMALEAAELARQLPDVFGQFTVQIGSWAPDALLIRQAGTQHFAVLGTAGDASAAAVVDPQQLPLLSKSVDALVLPHTLEFVHSPHTVLREADRVLSDRGRIYVLGFSPWGMASWRALLGLRARGFPPGARFYGVGRVQDWLELLGFEVFEVRRYSVGFPWLAPRSCSEGWSPARLLLPLTEAYLLCARKRVLPINWVGRAARVPLRPLIGVGVPAAQRSEPDR